MPNSTHAHPDDGGRFRYLAIFVAALMVMLIVVCGGAIVATASERPLNVTIPGPSDTSTPHGEGDVSDMWRDIRMGEPGRPTTPGGEALALIQSEGLEWQDRRYFIIIRYGAMVLIGVIAVIAAYFLIRGRIRIDGGRTGEVMPRFTLVQRVTHWFVAALFVGLGVSGLILLFGRDALLPLLGAEAFAVVASAAMQGHNLFGPLFLPAILALLVTFVRGNGYRLVDFKWLVNAGGFFGGHASSHKYNFGEKTWFWWSIALGLVLSVSGMMMLFPNLVPDRGILQLANLAHAAAAIAAIAFAIGHIYLGTIGMEGALEGMTRGVVDTNWAREHHDLWHEEHAASATQEVLAAEARAAAYGDAAPREQAG